MQTIGRIGGTIAQRFVIAALACTAWMSACNRPSPPTEPPAVVEDLAPAEAAVAEPVTAANSSTKPEEDVAAAKPTPRVERIVLFTPRGPLVVHLEIVVSGHPQSLAVEQVLSEAARAGGAKESGDANWAELVASPQFATGQWGNAPSKNPADGKRITQEFDFNRDGRVQRDELTACLAQNNVGGRAFSVQGADQYGSDDKQPSPLFTLFDEDQDGQLSAAEMAAAHQRLRSRDADDDEVVTEMDFRPPVSPNQAMRGSGGTSSPQAMELTRLKMDAVLYALGEWYDTGNGLDRASFALSPTLATQLDLDDNDKIDQQEINALLDARPDLVLKVGFAAPSPAKGDAPPVQATLSDDLIAAGAVARPQAGGLEFQLPGCELDAFANDLVGESDSKAQVVAQFTRLDSNNDGSLDESELGTIAVVGVSLKDLDQNGDGKLSLEEASAALGKQQSYATLQIQVRVGEVQDPLFSWLDVKHDGRLTSRDILGTADRLAQLDHDGDGFVSATEIPQRLSLVIVRGSAPREPRNQFTARRYASPADSSLKVPAWMVAMDQNGDGEVSPREFPGTPEQFAQWDANADGFLDASEALLVEAQPESTSAAKTSP